MLDFAKSFDKDLILLILAWVTHELKTDDQFNPGVD